MILLFDFLDVIDPYKVFDGLTLIVPAKNASLPPLVIKI